MSSDPVSWTIYVLIVFAILIANGLVSASLNALDCVDRNKLNEILEDEPNNKRVELIHNFIKNHLNTSIRIGFSCIRWQ